jgi:hypothetical protein
MNTGSFRLLKMRCKLQTAGSAGIARLLTRMSGGSLAASVKRKQTEGRIKHAVVEPLDNGNVTDQPSAKVPGAAVGGSIVKRGGR